MVEVMFNRKMIATDHCKRENLFFSFMPYTMTIQRLSGLDGRTGLTYFCEIDMLLAK